MDTPDKGIHIPGKIEWDSARFYRTTQNSALFKTCLFLEFSMKYFQTTGRKLQKRKLWIRGPLLIWLDGRQG